MKRLTAKGIYNYLFETYGEVRHCERNMYISIKITAHEFTINPVELFHLIVEDKPMEGTHSYGFHTRYRRDIINTFERNYYKLIK